MPSVLGMTVTDGLMASMDQSMDNITSMVRRMRIASQQFPSL
jgi:hypothetical protein